MLNIKFEVKGGIKFFAAASKFFAKINFVIHISIPFYFLQRSVTLNEACVDYFSQLSSNPLAFIGY